jgi:hypothetical protein
MRSPRPMTLFENNVIGRDGIAERQQSRIGDSPRAQGQSHEFLKSHNSRAAPKGR